MLDRLAGNEAMKQHLQAALAGGKLAHSLLLCGEKGGVQFVLEADCDCEVPFSVKSELPVEVFTVREVYCDKSLIGSFVDVKITDALNWALIGEIV